MIKLKSIVRFVFVSDTVTAVLFKEVTTLKDE